MAHSRRSSFPRIGGTSRRRKVTWTSGPSGTHTPFSAAGTALFDTSVEAVVDDLTIVRLRGDLVIQVASSTDGDGFDDIAIGICIVNQNAAGIGVSAIPQPLTDIFWDGWFWYWTGSLNTLDVSLMGDIAEVRIPIDGKAMRKIHLTDNVVAVIQVAAEVGTSVLQARLNTRMLSKLP